MSDNDLSDDEVAKESNGVKASMRLNQSDDDCFENYEATSYREIVANKLAKILERDTEVEENNSENKKKIKKKKSKNNNDSSGVKLLSTSKTILTTNNEDPIIINKKKLKINNKKNDDDDDDLASRCKEAAVDPDWILSRCEIKHWNERQKGLVYKYKEMPNGLLVEQ